MERAAFRALAATQWIAIPERFRAGAVLLLHDELEPDPYEVGACILGACEGAFGVLEDGFAGIGDPRAGERQSLVHIWYGSFVQTAALAHTFDWVGELEETLLHELMHHWEHRSGLDGLDRFDVAQMFNFRRLRGYEVPVGYWRDGAKLGPRRWGIDGDVFMEVIEAPPWTVDPGDGGPVVVCGPDLPWCEWATVFERGEMLDGGRCDLVICRAPRRERGGLRRWLREGWRRLRGQEEAR